MFNNYKAGDVTNTLKINACSGGIYKTYPKSWFKRFSLNDNLFAMLCRKSGVYYDEKFDRFERDIYYEKDKRSYKEVLILQMVICGDMEVIAELILKEDFEIYNGKVEGESNVKD